MTKKQCRDLLDHYQSRLEEGRAKPVEIDHYKLSPSKEESLDNALFMIGRMRKMLKKAPERQGCDGKVLPLARLHAGCSAHLRRIHHGSAPRPQPPEVTAS
jgi:hypothetical protein